jgi:hypothetical protein
VRGVVALPDGAYAVELEPGERDLVRSLAGDLLSLVERDDGAVSRLFPAAYRDDPDAERDYRRLVRDGLVDGRRRSLLLLQETADAERLTAEEADLWCTALNDLRLVLGEQLGVTEELAEEWVGDDDPRAPRFAVYGWLTWLQGSVVDALASRLA